MSTEPMEQEVVDVSSAWQWVMAHHDEVGLPVVVEWITASVVDPVPSPYFAALAYMARHNVRCVNLRGCSFGYGGPPKIEINGSASNQRLGVVCG